MPDVTTTGHTTKPSESVTVKRQAEIEALRAYFDKHKLSETIEGIINTVGNEKPDDCYGIMVKNSHDFM